MHRSCPPCLHVVQAKKAAPAAEKPAAAAAAPSKKVPPAVAAASGKAAKAAPPASTDTFKYKFTPEDADALAADMVPAQMQTDLADAQWKIRLAALDEVTTWLDGELNGDGLECEVLIRFLGKKPGWGEKNFQVSSFLQPDYSQGVYTWCCRYPPRSMRYLVCLRNAPIRLAVGRLLSQSLISQKNSET